MKKLFFILIFFCFVFQVSGQDSIEDLYRSFDRANFNGDYEEAVMFVQKIIKGNNDSVPYDEYLLANMYAMQNKQKETLDILKKLKSTSPHLLTHSIYNMNFAVLRDNAEYVLLTQDSTALFFVEWQRIKNEYNKGLEDKEYQKCLDIDIKLEKFYNSLNKTEQEKLAVYGCKLKYSKADLYTMMGEKNMTLKLLEEIKDTCPYVIKYILSDSTFDVLKSDKRYKSLQTTQKCDCKKSFEWAVKEFSEIDAGYDYIIEKKGRKSYDEITSKYRKQSTSAKTVLECEKVVNEWLQFFRRLHIGFAENSPLHDALPDIATNFDMKRLSKNTIYFRLGTVQGGHNAEFMHHMITANSGILSGLPNWIIDIRNNPGGLIDAWDSIKPYIKSGPYFNYGYKLMASETTAKLFDGHEGLKFLVDSLRNNKGKLLEFEQEKTVLITPKELKENPKKIVILVDNQASSAEMFTLFAKQSAKVKVMGQSSMGAIDFGYAGQSISPNNQFKLFYSYSKANWLPDIEFDESGIQPDIILKRGEDWIKIAQDFLESKP